MLLECLIAARIKAVEEASESDHGHPWVEIVFVTIMVAIGVHEDSGCNQVDERPLGLALWIFDPVFVAPPSTSDGHSQGSS